MNIYVKPAAIPERPQAERRKHYPPGMNTKNCDQLDSYHSRQQALATKRGDHPKLADKTDDQFIAAIGALPLQFV